jgi:hypothetical protein
MSPNNPSQKEYKQNFILQANATTRESLQQDSEEKGKTQKKQKPVKVIDGWFRKKRMRILDGGIRIRIEILCPIS